MHKSAVLIYTLTLLACQASIAIEVAANRHEESLAMQEQQQLQQQQQQQRQHSLRHQEHYEQRIQKAVDDFKKERDKNFFEAGTQAIATKTTTSPLIQQQQQQQQQQRREEILTLARAAAATTTTTNSDYNKNLRLQQFNAAQTEQQQQQQLQQHHLRHEQHLHQRRQFKVSQQQHPQQYHLRHQNRQQKQQQQQQQFLQQQQQHAWEQHGKPPMRHQHHRFAYAAAKMPQITTTRTTTALEPTTEGPPALSWNQTKAQRYFDRDSINSGWTQTTRRPRLYAQPSPPPLPTTSNRFNLAFGDDNRPFQDNDFDEDSTEEEEVEAKESDRSGNRFSLKLENSGEQLKERQVDDRAAVDKNNNDDDDNDDDDVDEQLMKAKYNNDYGSVTADERHVGVGNNNDNDDDDDDDYAYDESQDTAGNQNELPSISSPADKMPKKRNLFTNFFKSFQTQSAGKNQEPETKLKSKTEHKLKPSLAKLNENNENDENDLDAVEEFSNEKWNKIEHEHHLRQQQHQKELQALMTNKAEMSTATKPNEHEDNIYPRYYTQGAVTAQKQSELGTPEAVSHQVYVSRNSKEKALADRHMSQMITMTKCQHPQPRVVRIHKETNKRYSPSCTVLHRCAEDTGCCKSTQICAPKYTEIITKSFYVHVPRKVTTIEKHSFVNHTACHCVDRSKIAENSYYSGANAILLPEDELLNIGFRAENFNCTCPVFFDRILTDNFECRCDCSSSNIACVRFKRGIEHFSMQDRKCIRARRCKPPTCEFGSYNSKDGSCPKQGELSIASNFIS